jgi:prepilin-type N-terminal cleavage/methylation domain-containing protein
MIRQRLSTRRSRRRGFSLVEMIVALTLASMLGILLAQACATFGRTALEVEARARIAREAILATQSLACDLGGYLADGSGRTGTRSQYQFTSWNLPQASPPGSLLWLNFQGASSGNPIVIKYEWLAGSNQLVRFDSSTGVTTTTANYVTAFSVAPEPGNAANVQITLTITFRNFAATYTLIGVKPSS